jgi:hypothetical protein
MAAARSDLEMQITPEARSVFRCIFTATDVS